MLERDIHAHSARRPRLSGRASHQRRRAHHRRDLGRRDRRHHPVPDAAALCSWAGLTPEHHESDVKARRGRISIASIDPSAVLATARQRPLSAARAGFDGVELIGLAVAAPLLTVRSIDLDHLHPGALQEPGQPGAVGAGALHPDPRQLTEPASQPCSSR